MNSFARRVHTTTNRHFLKQTFPTHPNFAIPPIHARHRRNQAQRGVSEKNRDLSPPSSPFPSRPCPMEKETSSGGAPKEAAAPHEHHHYAAPEVSSSKTARGS
jgi:hypothetical protein